MKRVLSKDSESPAGAAEDVISTKFTNGVAPVD